MIITVTKNIAKRPELTNDMDGVIDFQDLMGSTPVRGNPLDMDVINSSEEGDFVNAAGKKVKKPAAKGRPSLLTGMRNRRAARQTRKDTRVNSKAEARLTKAGAKATKAGAKVLDAKGKIEAAKTAGKDDGSAKILAASLNQPSSPAPKSEGLSTGAKIGIGVGIAAVAIGLTVLIIKMRKK